MVDYSKLSNEDLINLKNGNYSAISNEGLLMLKGGSRTATEPQKPRSNKGIDLTPSNLLRQVGAAPVSAFESFVTGKPFGEIQQKNVARQKELSGGLGKVSNFLTDTLAYSALPQAKLAKGGAFVNNALTGLGQGAVIGGLEGLKREGAEGIIPGMSGGALLGGSLTAGLPLTANIAQKSIGLLPKVGGLLSKTLGRVKPETLEQAVKPTSRALDLNAKQAQNLLMDTTERVQKDYQTLLDKAGEEVQKAALTLPENRGVFTSSLKDSLDDIYNASQVSTNQKLNPAMQGNSDIYNKINNWIESGATPEKLTAPEMYDLMSNIKRNIPIDWEKPTAQARNALKQQIYGDYARRLGNLSPELRQANKAFSDLAQFENNEGVRRILQPVKKGDLDVPSSALRNYNSTVTKGNTNRNIQDLEKILVENGKQPFLNDIDDVNAAMDLLNVRGTGDSWLANMATQATRPVLRGVRAYNRFAQNRNLPALFDELGQRLPRLFTPVLYGGVNNLFDD